MTIKSKDSRYEQGTTGGQVKLAACVVTMEACGGAHFRAREIGRLGHDVRLIPLAYVKPFVKRQSETDKKTIR